MNKIIIIGTGLAGYNLARELRKLDTFSELTVITNDEGHYYSKPQLSSALTNNKTSETLANLNVEKMRTQLNAEILTNTKVDSIDTKNKLVLTNHDTQKQISYDTLVLACGAYVTNPRLTGTGLSHVYSINDLKDYSKFRDALKNKKHITILGSGLIGCEFANDLLNADFKVSVVSLGQRPLEELLPPEASDAVSKALKAHGADWHWKTTITEVVAQEDNRLLIKLNDNKSFTSDLVVSAIGIKPNINLAEQAELKVNKGIVVDQYLQTSEKNIYAIGDCAEICGHVFQYVLPISHAARALARTISGLPSQVNFPAMPINIKTPICPVVVSPAPKIDDGRWEIESAANHVKALFLDSKNNIRGFALTGDRVKHKLEFTTLLPPLLPIESKDKK